ncbi:uncharacterized protein LOC131659504 [Vicia villosa]|uniref:uncharacterized protein LOC131659504 n=1 Tax=Vicia villosa TaxID=3911 RepID=UPI00273AF837|nr:uncharacterized protein LOC131659504 [Vicia villosa]
MLTNNKIFVWNCRGASSSAFYRYCKNYVNQYKPAMMIVVETRCNPTLPSKAFKKLGYDMIESSVNNGFTGGIIMGWRLGEMNVHVCQKNEQYNHVSIKEDNDMKWYFTTVYARPNEDSKKILWDDLKVIASSMSDPWMLVGDFNDIAYVSDKRGGATPSMSRCRRFRDRMDMCLINDVEVRGPVFTWRGPIYHGGQHIYEKLDRAVSNDDWRLQFPDAYVKVLARVEFSDHHPILVNLREEQSHWRERPFRFENAWLNNDSYNSMLKEVWKKDSNVEGNLKNVVDGIKKWKLDSFDEIKRTKNSIMRKLGGIQRSLQMHDNVGGMRRLEVKLQKELSNILNQEELLWH